MMLTPKKSGTEIIELTKCEQELSEWHENLPPDCSYPPDRKDCKVVILNRAILNMFYLLTSSALHRPQILSELPSQTLLGALQQLSRQKVKEAAIGTTETARHLQEHNLIRYLPPLGVTVFLPPIIMHPLDSKSEDLATRDRSLQRFYLCMRALQRLRDIFPSADFATSFVEATILKAGIHVPLEVELTSGYSPVHLEMTPRTAMYVAQTSREVRASLSEGIPSTVSQNGAREFFMEGIAGESRNLTNSKIGPEISQDFDLFIDFDACLDLFMAEHGLDLGFDRT